MENLSVKKIGKQSYLLLEDITVNSLGYEIKLLKGFDFDAASIPKIFWSIIGSPFTGNYTTPAAIHDGLYAGEILDRKVCDDIFLDLMKQYKVSYLIRYAMYWAVRLGGGKVWKEHSQEEVQEYKKYCEIMSVNATDINFEVGN